MTPSSETSPQSSSPSAPSRRGLLKLIGGGVVLAAIGGGAAAYVAGAPSAEARLAWRSAGAPEEYRRRFLSYALLAPNPHNRQPWLVRLDGEDALTLFCDLDRRLPATDPFDRQIVIGCGAFLELLSIAAASEGYRAEITPFPEGEPQPRLDARPVARVRFIAGAAERDAAFGHILARVTNRKVFTDQPVSAAQLAALQQTASVQGVTARTTAEAGDMAALRDLTWRGHEREARTPGPHKESVDLMRIGKAEVERWRDGISLEGPMMEALKLAGVASRAELADESSFAFGQMVETFRPVAASAQAFVWLITDADTRAAQIASGRAYARATLKVAELGLAIHPWSQTLQEYPDMADLYEEVHAMLGEGGRVQMLARLGYASPSIHAPRRGLDAHVMASA
jgi:hypothetical protein